MDPEPSWNWPPGHELAPGLLAWALLGDGRRCETWLAWDLGRWCPVVVKVPRPGGATGRAVAALAQEAQVAGSVAHPGIRRLLEARLDQPVAHLVFEYVEGPTLDDALAEDGPFHLADALLTGMQLAAALGHLHGRGLAHLDVKPGNVVLREGRPVLIDLGLGRPLGEAPGRHRRGSPPWMAPEQVRRLPASPGMDLFALGAVLFELATGTQAFDPADTGPPERRWPQLAGPPPPASSRNSEVPAALDRAIATLLAPDPAGRPPPPARCSPCWPRPCRPTPPRRTGCGLSGLPGTSAPGKAPPWRVPRSLHDLRRLCGWPIDPPCQDGCAGKDFGSPREPSSRGGPSWESGGAAGGCMRSPAPGSHGGSARADPRLTLAPRGGSVLP